MFKESYKNSNKREKEEKEEPTSSIAKREVLKAPVKDQRLKRLERKKTKNKSGVNNSKDTIEKIPTKDGKDSTLSKQNDTDTTSVDSKTNSKRGFSKSNIGTFSQGAEEEEEEE